MAQPYINWSNVRSVLANVDSFDSKSHLNENDFVQSTQDTLANSGYVGRLYRDGVDLGAAQESAVAVTSDGHWFYDSTTDILYTFNTNDATEYVWESAPDTLANLQALYMNTGAEMFESMLDPRFPRPLPKSTRSYSGASYEAPIIKGVALYAAREAIIRTDPEAPELLQVESQLQNETRTGLIDLIKDGNLKFEFEKTDSDEEGEIVVGAINVNTTGYPIETSGDSTVPFSKLKAYIVTGGTITFGTENTTVTYSVIDGEGSAHVNAEIIDITQYQPVGNGVSVAWSDGVYTADDYWYIYTRQKPTSKGLVGTIKLRRV